MKLAIRSASPVIARNLRAIAEQVGWVIADDALVTLNHSGEGLQLVRGNDVVPLACPIHPNALLDLLQFHANPATAATHRLAHAWLFDPVLRQVSGPGESIGLTEKESLLLSALLTAEAKTCGRDALLRDVWSYETDIETHTLETHIYRLRQKLETLEPPPCRIETIDGAYRLVLASAD